MVKKQHGGSREGAGRPPKSPDEILQRKQRQVRAFDDEWELINRFAHLVKHRDADRCREVLELLENE